MASRLAIGSATRELDLNGQPGVVFETQGKVNVALTLDIADGRVVAVRVVTNPDKLHALQPGNGGYLSGGHRSRR
ncbi:MAG TPA: hypothetical protein VNC61_07320 [Acidimicrobiales bacterium]|nr:hypothetical protein [Acidimicrobiales bacterium]